MRTALFKKNAFLLFILGALAILAYIPALAQPFIEDDFPNIKLALIYGPSSGWEKMADDPVQRVRATTFIFSYTIYRIFGLQPVAFYAANLFLHILNCWLLFAVGRWRLVGFKVSFWAAAFFAVYEGHQEAVMWFSACNEVLMFLFGFLSFLFWLIFQEKETSRLRWLSLSFFFFLLTLLSKESSVIFLVLFALPLLFPRRNWRETASLLPYVLIGGVYMASIFITRSHSFRFHDQSFVLSAPFWLTWVKSYGALLWFWGLSALVATVWWGSRGQPFLLSFLWMGISFIPYMFVDYMHRIPSRQTYLASAGLALLMGAAIVSMTERYGKHYRWGVRAVLVIILFHNVGYLWTKKRQQFLERAQPTEQLLSFAKRVDGPIYMKCFPLDRSYGEAALELILNKPASVLIWKEEEARTHPQAAIFCYEKLKR
jgi:hypothetical protein